MEDEVFSVVDGKVPPKIKSLSRYCRFCGKKLVHGQNKFCCKDHWLLFEKSNTHTGRLSGSKKALLSKRKVMVDDEE